MSAVLPIGSVTSMLTAKILLDLMSAPAKLNLLEMGKHAPVRECKIVETFCL